MTLAGKVGFGCPQSGGRVEVRWKLSRSQVGVTTRLLRSCHEVEREFPASSLQIFRNLEIGKLGNLKTAQKQTAPLIHGAVVNKGIIYH
jgi:hypothetical protein